MDESELARLRATVDRLESERDVVAVTVRCAQAIDYGDEPGFVDCFWPDGVLEIHSAGISADVPARGGSATSEGVRYEGHEQLAALAAAHTRAPEAFHKHHALIPDVRVDGDSATSDSYILRLDVDTTGLPYIRAFGRYRDRLERRDGGWRITHRVAETEAFDPRPFRRRSDSTRA